MDSCKPDCKVCTIVNDKDKLGCKNNRAEHKNQQSNKTSGINCQYVAEKSELQNILRTVSLLCSDNPTETAGTSNDDDCKIILDCPKNTDREEVEIVDVVINRNHAKKMSAIKLDSAKSENNQLKERSNIPENVVDSVNVQEVQNTNKSDICENITDSVGIQVVQNINVNDTSENAIHLVDIQVVQNIDINDTSENTINSVGTQEACNINECNTSENTINSVDIQVVQNINENDTSENNINSVSTQEARNINEYDTSKNLEIVSEDVSENYLCEVPASEHASTTENMPVASPKTDFASASNAMDESDLNCNCSEKCVSENTTDTIEMGELESSDDNTMCDENMDMTEKPDEYCTYEIEYDFKPGPPTQITGSWNEFTGKKNNFTKGCKWAPDGSCIVTCNDDNKLRIFNLPPQLWDSSQWSNISELEAVLRISESDIIYDYCWYPLMNSNDPSTCCLVSTSRKNTVHMWDAYSGELRCSYRSFNHLDELVTPHSLCFDSDGEKLFCGFHNVIRVFDVNRPGRIFEERQVYGHKSGQCGIISCFAFTSADKNISAAGSYQKSIGLYAEPYGELSCLLEGQGNGVTQLQFSPDGKHLYSGGRKDPEILCWDLRNLGTVLFSLRRSCDTNQRMYFDISRCGKYVVSGNQNGVITFWDVTSEPKEIEKSYFPVLVPVRFYLAHDDCVNGVSFHPFYPLLCSSSGQRKFPVLLDDNSEHMFSYDMEKQDNSLRLWWIGKSSV